MKRPRRFIFLSFIQVVFNTGIGHFTPFYPLRAIQRCLLSATISYYHNCFPFSNRAYCTTEQIVWKGKNAFVIVLSEIVYSH